jgi:hypothetical protein
MKGRKRMEIAEANSKDKTADQENEWRFRHSFVH